MLLLFCLSFVPSQEEQLRTVDQVLAFCAPAAPSCNDQRIQFVHLSVGIFGWQDERVRVSWEQVCETGEQGEPLLSVDISCIGRQHVELHSLWLTMQCPYTQQLVSSCSHRTGVAIIVRV